MRVIAIANHKGGVGKTTTTHALGSIFAREYGLRTLMVDCDPQSSLTMACGIAKEDAALHNLAQALRRSVKAVDLNDLTIPLGNGFCLVPADREALSDMQLELSVRRVGRDTALRAALGKLRDFDMVLLDCMPGIDLLSINALVACTHVLVPTKPQVLDLGGLAEFFDTLDELEMINPDLHRLGVLLTFYHGRYSLHQEIVAQLEDGSGRLDGFELFKTRIGESVRVAEAPGQGKSLLDHAGSNPRMAEYRALAAEVVERLEQMPCQLYR